MLKVEDRSRPGTAEMGEIISLHKISKANHIEIIEEKSSTSDKVIICKHGKIR